MRTEQKSFLEILGCADTRLAVPIYQRTYSWRTQQVRELWDDAIASARTGERHFCGVLYFEEDCDEDGVPVMSLIDGQQRLTTVTLILAALRDSMRAGASSSSLLSADEIDAKYLQLSGDGGRPECKLVLSNADACTMGKVVCGERPSGDEDEVSRRIEEVHAWCTSRMAKDSFDADALVVGLRNLEVVAVKLEEGDRPQAVFDSLNSKGTSLTTLDLLRNLLMSGFPEEEKAVLNRTYWGPMEALFERDEDDRYLKGCFRWWLVRQTGRSEFADAAESYAMFKERARGFDMDKKVQVLDSISRYCRQFMEHIDSPRGTDLRRLCNDWANERAFRTKGLGLEDSRPLEVEMV